MAKKLPAYPAFVRPQIPQAVSSLQYNTLIPEITNFATGAYDFQNFPQISNILSQRNKQGLRELQQQILGAQGAQGQSGGLAIKQLGKLLSDYQLADQERQALLGYDIYKGNLANRQYGIGAGQGTVGQEQSYATNLANMENAYNQNAWNAAVQNTLYRRANANTFENIALPLLAGFAGQAASGLGDIANARVYNNYGVGGSINTPFGYSSNLYSAPYMPQTIQQPAARTSSSSGLSSLEKLLSFLFL